MMNAYIGCTDFCPGQNVRAAFNCSARLTIAMISYVVLAWLPSLVILLISTTWSCVVFKKCYTGGNDQLNRWLISLPVILPTGFILTTIFTLLLRHLVLIPYSRIKCGLLNTGCFSLMPGAMISLLDHHQNY